MVYELDAEEAKALDAFRTLTAEQRRSLAESEKGTHAASRQGKVVKFLTGEWKSSVPAGMIKSKPFTAALNCFANMKST